MHSEQTVQVAATLTQQEGVHEQWSSDYRTPENERFFELAFDRIVELLCPATNASVLDAGCGCGRHSVRLANRNLRVTAVDFSESMIGRARERLGNRNSIQFQCDDLLDLSFDDEVFDHVVCWGVLMHVVEAERAIEELARVLKPGGYLAISEANMHSLQAYAFELARKLTKKGDATKERTNIGMEYWTETESGKLLTRESDVKSLTDVAAANRLKLQHRIAGQFTEAYTRVSSPSLRTMVHSFNHLWFKYIGWAAPAFGNILIFRRDG